MASKYRKRGVWYIRYKDTSGRWTAKSCGADATAADAEYLRGVETAKELNTRHQAPVRIAQINLYEALEDYRKNEIPKSNLGRDKAPRSIRREQVCLENFVRWARGERIRDYQDITESTIVKYLSYLQESGKSQRTRFEERRMLHCFYKWSIKQYYCAADPVQGVPSPKLTKKKPRFFSEEELRKIFEHAKPPYDMLFKFLYLTGMRIGEVGNVECRDYQPANRHILLRVMVGNKTKREEVVYLSPEAVAIIDEFNRWKQSYDSDDSKRYLFVNTEGRKLDNDNFYRNLKRTMKDAGVQDGSPHVFRHTCASHLVIKGVSLYVVSKVLRHASIKETEIYAHLSNEAVESAVGKLSLNFSASIPAPPKPESAK